MRGILVLLAVLLPAATQAAPSGVAQREIQGLMDALSASSCEFQRNGTWHGRDEARKHLQRKYDGARRRRMQGDAEAFIAQAASRSSMTGRPYRVSCPGQPETDAGDWFRARLHALRVAVPAR